MHNLHLIEQSKQYAVLVEGLSKKYIADKTIVEAVKNVSIKVPRSSIYGFLGPNGAGKTSILRMLTTLLKPTSGKVVIAGLDLAETPSLIRKKIGYVSQLGGCDHNVSGKENLILQARLYGMSRTKAIIRTDELIALFQLEHFCHRSVKTYSGGQRRRVDLAMSLIHRPEVLFLDEPTTGLDPQSRAFLWDELLRCKSRGMTIFLTTHQLEEAESVCDQIAIIDKGVVIAENTPNELKKMIAGENIIITVSSEVVKQACDLLKDHPGIHAITTVNNSLHLGVTASAPLLPKLIGTMSLANITIEALTLKQISLNEVFLTLTGRALRDQHS